MKRILAPKIAGLENNGIENDWFSKRLVLNVLTLLGTEYGLCQSGEIWCFRSSSNSVSNCVCAHVCYLVLKCCFAGFHLLSPD